ncbi:hypothetical protein [Paenibacillus harenae]|uniref:Uncharacterized protein n=1 Tax=Paenibacillus harenae TaxID=306543 RepID=A0ABT9U558_PAEHA|nr:hypothetical protein [Paenibacillus harenae]MDQ0062284.1 hypothetical protein [Paenibacillus harenae]MDQ0114708.1 hypothetical protein [Paenibacillus harenae]
MSLNSNKLEKVLWSVAFPGFGQLLNGKFFKGILLIGMELLINVQSNLNKVIISSFRGDISEAIAQTDYQWLMFYPCIYMFAIWDAYRDAGGGNTPYAVVPIVFGAYFGTLGVIFSSDIFGAVWLGLCGMFAGLSLGLLIKKILIAKRSA